MKTKYLSLLTLPLLLIGCTERSNFNKLTLPRVEYGRLVTISGEELYDMVINEVTTMLVLFSVDSCASCSEAKEELEGLAELGHFNVYNVDLTNITSEDYQYIVDTTSYANDAYAFNDYGDELYLPQLYLFAYQGVVVTFDDYFVDNIIDYINLND